LCFRSGVFPEAYTYPDDVRTEAADVALSFLANVCLISLLSDTEVTAGTSVVSLEAVCQAVDLVMPKVSLTKP
jgi:hypothetical protein